MSQPRDKEFLKLQKLWYKKAAQSGYVDIEQDEDNLKIWDGHRIKAKYTPDTFQAKEEYYRMAGNFLNDHVFQDKMDKLIWEFHTEGHSAPEIVKMFKKKKVTISLSRVHKLIKILADEMLSCLKKT